MNAWGDPLAEKGEEQAEQQHNSRQKSEAGLLRGAQYEVDRCGCVAELRQEEVVEGLQGVA